MEYIVTYYLDKELNQDYGLLTYNIFTNDIINLSVFTNGKEQINFKELYYTSIGCEKIRDQFIDYFSCGKQVLKNALEIRAELNDFDGKISKEESIDLIKKNTRHLAKRQLTWFRRYEDLTWFDITEYGSDDKAVEAIITWLQNK